MGISRMPLVPMSTFDLPINIDYDYQYYEQLMIKFNKYLEVLEYLVKERGLHKDVVDSARNNINLIISSLDNYYNAEVDIAKHNILHILKKYERNEYIITTINKSYACRGVAPFIKYKSSDQHTEDMKSDKLNFYRARVSPNGLDRMDMLHIPFNRRDLISTERFSISGVPCLYLGATSYVCWLEMGKAKDAEFYTSSFQIPEDLKIIDLTASSLKLRGTLDFINEKGWYELNNLQKEEFGQRIEFWPLICATSFSVKHSEGKFKSEYIISQLIMQCLKDLMLDGIAYISKKVMREIAAYPQCVNIAIPMKSNGKYNINGTTNIYSNIAIECKLTTPVNLAEFQMLKKSIDNDDKESFINKYFNKSPNGSIIDFAGSVMKYKECIFSDFDDYLVNLDHAVYNSK